MDSWGHVTGETLGNNVKTTRSYDAVTSWLTGTTAGEGGGAGLLNQAYLQDKTGNVTQRQNNAISLSESFWYDADNRLTCASLTSTCPTPTFIYDGAAPGPGNITTQVWQLSSPNVTNTYAYPGPGHAQPHAVQSITGSLNGISNPTFSYDANGNMTARASSTANITWSSYNYPLSIAGSDSTGSEMVSFTYGPDRQRVTQTYTLGSNSEVTYYIGGLLEEVATNIDDYRHYVYAGNEPIALYSRKSTLTSTMSYLSEDHLGGVAVIANAAGAANINESFTAFGSRRNPTNPSAWTLPASASDLTTIATYSREGYTFQTALGQSLGLNHLNGRVEDAVTGRFLSPDPVVQDPTNAQDYNRFSYVMNDPLTFSDPTGFCWLVTPTDTTDPTTGLEEVSDDFTWYNCVQPSNLPPLAFPELSNLHGRSGPPGIQGVPQVTFQINIPGPCANGNYSSPACQLCASTYLNNTYGNLGGFIAESFNLQQSIPYLSGQSIQATLEADAHVGAWHYGITGTSIIGGNIVGSFGEPFGNAWGAGTLMEGWGNWGNTLLLNIGKTLTPFASTALMIARMACGD